MLRVELGTECSESSCDCTAHDLNEAFSTKSGDVVVVSSGSVKFSFDQESSTATSTSTATATATAAATATANPHNTMAIAVAIFVPPSFIDQHLPPSHHKGSSCKSVVWLSGDPKIMNYQDFTTGLLAKIHTSLAECSILGIVRQTFMAADIILLDMPSSTNRQPWIHDNMVAALDGEEMAGRIDAILKILPLSKVVFETKPIQNSPEETAALERRHLEIPSCPVCLHRIDPVRLGLPKPKNYQLCSNHCVTTTNLVDGRLVETCSNQRFLTPWPPPGHCTACHVIHDYWNPREDGHVEVFCNRCAMEETLWVCLTCGYVACGRYTNVHSVEHYQESHHRYSLELVTFRIWDYVTDEFAHRGDFLQCSSILNRQVGLTTGSHAALRRTSSMESTDEDKPRLSSNTGGGGGGGGTGGTFESPELALIKSHQNFYAQSGDDTSQKKAMMIGEEYEALLQSALDEQAQHYEGEISRLRAELTAEQIDEGAMTQEEIHQIESVRKDIANYRVTIETLGRQVLDLQGQEAGYRASSQRLLREQSVTKQLLDKIREEASREHAQGKMQLEELEQQIADLTANLTMRHQFSQDEELSNAQIFGTTSTNTNNKKTKRGKKLRRLFR